VDYLSPPSEPASLPNLFRRMPPRSPASLPTSPIRRTGIATSRRLLPFLEYSTQSPPFLGESSAMSLIRSPSFLLLMLFTCDWDFRLNSLDCQLAPPDSPTFSLLPASLPFPPIPLFSPFLGFCVWHQPMHSSRGVGRPRPFLFRIYAFPIFLSPGSFAYPRTILNFPYPPPSMVIFILNAPPPFLPFLQVRPCL